LTRTGVWKSVQIIQAQVTNHSARIASVAARHFTTRTGWTKLIGRKVSTAKAMMMTTVTGQGGRNA
jgi:hypothetical protein